MRIGKLREAGGSLPADPVAELIAWLSRGQLEVRDIGFGFPLVFALLIEVVSAFGPVALVAYADATRRGKVERGSMPEPAMARSGELRPGEAGSGQQGRVVTWMAERTEPTVTTSAIGIADLHADYEVWCLHKNMAAATVDGFEQELDP